MMEGFYFVLFGLAGGLAYLSWIKQQDLLAYGLGLLGIASFLSGVSGLVTPEDVDGGTGIVQVLDLLRNIALGGGISFLAYIGGLHGLRQYQARQARERERLNALRLDARKDAEPRSSSRPQASR